MNIADYFTIKKIFPGGDSQPSRPVVNTERLGPKEIYLTWEALGRPMHKASGQQLTRTLGIIGVVVALFLVILQEYFLIIVIASFIFVSQVLSKTPPELVKYEISSYGVTVDGKIYYWEELRRYFLFESEGQRGVAVDLVNGFPSRLFLTADPATSEKAVAILGKHLEFLSSAPVSFFDRAYTAMSGKLVNK